MQLIIAFSKSHRSRLRSFKSSGTRLSMPTRKRKVMKKFEVTIYSRQYETHIVDAENKGDAIEIANNCSEPVEVGFVDGD